MLIFALLTRGGVLAARYEQLIEDPDTYRQLAVGLIHHGVYGYPVARGAPETEQLTPTAFRPPLYPLLLAAVGWFSDVSAGSVVVLHLLLGIATVMLTWRIAMALGLGRISLLPAMLVACDPILLNQSCLVMTETPATCLAVLATWLLTRADEQQQWWLAALAGVAIGAAALCRPTFLIWLAACFIVLSLSCTRIGWRRAAALACGAMVMLVPWLVRNRLVFGRPVIATTHGGYTLLLGNNERFYEFLRRGEFDAVWDSTELDAEVNRIRSSLGHDELTVDRWAYDRARQAMRRDPTMFAWSCAVRVGRLWRLAPHRLSAEESRGQRLVRYAIGAWYLAAFTLAIRGAWLLGPRLARRPWLWGTLLCLAFSLLHVLYWSNLRMRAPLMPAVYLVAAAGVRRAPFGG